MSHRVHRSATQKEKTTHQETRRNRGPACMTRPSSEEMLRRQVGRRIHARRVWLGMNQQQLADKALVTRNFVSAMERGAQGLDTWRLWLVAEALDRSVDWVLAGPDAATAP